MDTPDFQYFLKNQNFKESNLLSQYQKCTFAANMKMVCFVSYVSTYISFTY